MQSYSKTQADHATQGKWLKLEDGESARIAFIGPVQTGDIESGLFRYPRHWSQRGGYQPCDRGPTDPVEVCDLCSSGVDRQIRVAYAVYNLDAHRQQVLDMSRGWEKAQEAGTWKHKPPTQSSYIVTRNGTGKDTRYDLIYDERLTDDEKSEIGTVQMYSAEQLTGGKRKDATPPVGQPPEFPDDVPPPDDDDFI